MDQKINILNHQEIIQKINRIAFQIYEDNYDEEKIILFGIKTKGFQFAEVLAEKIKSLSSLEVQLFPIELNKSNIHTSEIDATTIESLSNKSIVIIDDVLNTGKTLIYATSLCLKYEVRKIRTAVLIDRKHRAYPIKADFVGLTLSTTIKNHIEVDLTQPENYSAVLA